MRPRPFDASFRRFRLVEEIASAFPGVERVTRYDGAPGLTIEGVFMAAMAAHPSAEPESLVVKVDPGDRAGFLEDAPEIYYVTDSYRPHPVVLVRLERIERDALRDLLALSRTFALRKVRGRSPIRSRRG